MHHIWALLMLLKFPLSKRLTFVFHNSITMIMTIIFIGLSVSILNRVRAFGYVQVDVPCLNRHNHNYYRLYRITLHISFSLQVCLVTLSYISCVSIKIIIIDLLNPVCMCLVQFKTGPATIKGAAEEV